MELGIIIIIAVFQFACIILTPVEPCGKTPKHIPCPFSSMWKNVQWILTNLAATPGSMRLSDNTSCTYSVPHLDFDIRSVCFNRDINKQLEEYIFDCTFEGNVARMQIACEEPHQEMPETTASMQNFIIFSQARYFISDGVPTIALLPHMIIYLNGKITLPKTLLAWLPSRNEIRILGLLGKSLRSKEKSSCVIYNGLDHV
ncbi:hypothetical protein SprV_0902731400 [Sparganum proliferum]